MKGHLYKKLQPEGWYVVYASDEFGFHKTELPLHPEYTKYYFLDEDADGSEVEFDWCVIVDHDSGKGKEYAKLKRPKEQTNGERFEEFMNSVQYPELEGTMNLCNDVIKKTGKMTEEEWQAAEKGEFKYKDGTPIRSHYSAKIQELLDEMIAERAVEPFTLFIDDIDTELALIEDYAKGEVGEAITKLRKKIAHFYTTLK